MKHLLGEGNGYNAHAWKSPTFKKKLLANPKAALSEFGSKEFPSDKSLRVVEEGKNECIIILHPLPYSSSEISEEELKKVAGAGTSLYYLDNADCWNPITLGSGCEY